MRCGHFSPAQLNGRSRRETCNGELRRQMPFEVYLLRRFYEQDMTCCVCDVILCLTSANFRAKMVKKEEKKDGTRG